MQTYWVRTKQASSGQLSDVSEDCDSDEFDSEWLDLPADLYFDSQRSKLGLGSNAIRQCLSEQNQRLADWNSNQLLALLNQVVVQREASPDRRDSFDGQERTQEGQHEPFVVNAHIGVGDSGSIISEVKESISMPEFNCGLFQQLNGAPMRLSEVVQQQLHDFVSIICSMYVDHPFHSVSNKICSISRAFVTLKE